jgi:hypothetical protein
MFAGAVPDAKYIKELRNIGVDVLQDTTDIKRCTHLVASQLRRTVKLLCALCVADYIVSTDWMHACIEQRLIVDPTRYTLTDRHLVDSIENKFDFTLHDALQRAHDHGPLFKGQQFYVTKHVQPQQLNAGLKEIIHCAGGTVLTNIPGASGCLPALIVITCEQDRELCRTAFPTLSSDKFCSAEYILSSVFKQQICDNKIEHRIDVFTTTTIL